MISAEFSLRRKLAWDPDAHSPSDRRSILMATLTQWEGQEIRGEDADLCLARHRIFDMYQTRRASEGLFIDHSLWWEEEPQCIASQASTGLGTKQDCTSLWLAGLNRESSFLPASGMVSGPATESPAWREWRQPCRALEEPQGTSQREDPSA